MRAALDETFQLHLQEPIPPKQLQHQYFRSELLKVKKVKKLKKTMKMMEMMKMMMKMTKMMKMIKMTKMMKIEMKIKL